jgi:hypothetical protein
MRLRPWLRRHRLVAATLWAVLALGAIESILLLYYLNSWVTLPSL